MYHDFACVVIFSVVEGLVGSVGEDQLHSLQGPCSPQYSRAQSAGQLTDCHTDLNKQVVFLTEIREFLQAKRQIYPSTGSMDQYGLSRLDMGSGRHIIRLLMTFFSLA